MNGMWWQLRMMKKKKKVLSYCFFFLCVRLERNSIWLVATHITLMLSFGKLMKMCGIFISLVWKPHEPQFNCSILCGFGLVLLTLRFALTHTRVDSPLFLLVWWMDKWMRVWDDFEMSARYKCMYSKYMKQWNEWAKLKKPLELTSLHIQLPTSFINWLFFSLPFDIFPNFTTHFSQKLSP